jgi:uncharacterized protein YqhQ
MEAYKCKVSVIIMSVVWFFLRYGFRKLAQKIVNQIIIITIKLTLTKSRLKCDQAMRTHNKNKLFIVPDDDTSLS